MPLTIKVFALVLIVLVVGLHGVHTRESDEEEPTVEYSEYIMDVRDGLIDEVSIGKSMIAVTKINGQRYKTFDPHESNMIDDLLENRVKVKVAKVAGQSILVRLLLVLVPTLLFGSILIYFMRKLLGSMGRQMNFGDSTARLMAERSINVTFNDVAGIGEAKEDVSEIVRFLNDRGRYELVGAKIPRGILMVGPPGTGKTLLARAIAGEAGVPFFSVSGSDFVEMFVGVGASRVRDMFDEAKKKTPCIIFIDEIDAVGGKRGAPDSGSSNDEREQTLNQLLVEMDGFSDNEGVVVIAATNRPDVLDKALLRPGRFDRRVSFGLPDIKDREQILAVHFKKVPCADDVVIVDLARVTPGFSGAELANLVNEGALFAARFGHQEVTMDHLDKARDKMIMGAERRSMIMPEEERLMTAYHEAGHAIVGRLVPEHAPVYKVSILPRGNTLGNTVFLPEHDHYSMSRDKLESKIASLFGGRVAEEIIYGKNKVTTGASNDIECATELARNMVMKWGLSDKLGPIKYKDERQISVGLSESYSEKVAQTIDEEIRSLVDLNYSRALTLLNTNIDILHNMAQALMHFETINRNQVDELMLGKALVPEVKG